MNTEIRTLEPKQLWNKFADLNAVPRASKKEERVIAFMKDFGTNLGLEVIEDEVGNVIIKKPATVGMEDRVTIVMQSHLDMVHQKNADTNFDFDTQGIDMHIDGDWVKAKGTTLGADNGVGLSSALAVLASDDIPHGPLEVLVTIDEEAGMTGAFGLEAGWLEGDLLINTDSEQEGEVYMGCAGGIDGEATFAITNEDAPADVESFNLSISGLKSDINR